MSAEESSGPTSADDQVPYTVFTKGQKRLITWVIGYTNIASAFTATSYLPLLPLLREQFHVSAQEINLTITLYIVFQAISPMLFSTVSDSLGRRPVFLILFSIYTLASLGLSLNRNSYAGLLILRALQSLGASCGVSLCYGIVADVTTPAERGKMLGPVMAISNLGSCIGPMVGGSVALASGGYVWPFWCLTIYGGTVLLTVGFLLPETARQVVGNGSRTLAHWYLKTWGRLLRDLLHNPSASEKPPSAAPETQVRLKFANVLDAIRIIFYPDTALTLWLAGSYYAVYYCLQATISPVFKHTYAFNELEIGAAYVAGAAGVILGGFANGRLIDFAYRRTAASLGLPIDRRAGDDLTAFPIERARTCTAWPWIGLTAAALAGYGWAVQAPAQFAAPLVIQAVLGFTCTCMLQTFSALLIDVFPTAPSTASTAGNITRCALSAAGVAVLQPLVGAIGRGWFFTLLGALSGVAGFAAAGLLYARGMGWRRRRYAREERKKEAGRTEMGEGAEAAQGEDSAGMVSEVVGEKEKA